MTKASRRLAATTPQNHPNSSTAGRKSSLPGGAAVLPPARDLPTPNPLQLADPFVMALARRAALVFSGAALAIRPARSAPATFNQLFQPVSRSTPDMELSALVRAMKRHEQSSSLRFVYHDEYGQVHPGWRTLDALLLRAADLHPETDAGFAAKAWIVLAYAHEGQSGDKVFRSLMLDLAERGAA